MWAGGFRSSYRNCTFRFESLEARCLLTGELLGTFDGYAARITPIGEDLYYTVDESTSASAIREFHRRRSDGTFKKVLAINGRSLFLTNPMYITPAGGRVFFFGNESQAKQLWVLDSATDRATPLLPDGTTADTNVQPVALKERLYFVAKDAAAGTELWHSDGTSAGTARVRNVNPGSADSAPSELTVAGNTLFFAATTATRGRQLWRSDGTAAGTRLVRDLGRYPQFPASGASPTQMTVLGGRLYFVAAQYPQAERVWVSDGTAAGTREVAGNYSSPIYALTAAGTRLYFVAKDATAGREVWKLDSASSTARRVTDLEPGLRDGITDSSDDRFVAKGDDLYFSTYDDDPEPICACGYAYVGDPPPTTQPSPPATPRLWKIDGRGGRITTLYSGAVEQLTLANAKLYFKADGDIWTTNGTIAGTHSLGMSVHLIRGTAAGPVYFSDFDERLWRGTPHLGAVSGRVFNDLNADGAREHPEAGMSGYRVFIDRDNDGRLGGGEPSTVSNDWGGWHIGGLRPGNYPVRVEPQPGWSVPVASSSISVSAERTSKLDFALRGRPASISGIVFADLNGSGSMNPTETGAQGFRVYLDKNTNRRFDSGEPSAVTDATGTYRFENILPGVRQTVRILGRGEMWDFATRVEHSVTPNAGDRLRVHFGARPKFKLSVSVNERSETGSLMPVRHIRIYLERSRSGRWEYGGSWDTLWEGKVDMVLYAGPRYRLRIADEDLRRFKRAVVVPVDQAYRFTVTTVETLTRSFELRRVTT